MSKISSQDPDNFICDKCGRMIPMQNRDLHNLRCSSIPAINPDDELPPPPPPPSSSSSSSSSSQNTIICKSCTFINSSDLQLCSLCNSSLLNDENLLNCKACSYLNAINNDVCEICGTKLKDDFNLNDYFESRADLYVKCPTVNCLQYIEVSNPGAIERVVCPDCQYCFCSLCRELFHGIPNAKSEGKSFAFTERLSCDGAKSILQRWREYQVNGRIFNDKETAQKHHIDLKELVDSFGDEVNEIADELKRMNSEAYRLRCNICDGHIIGPRFSCINCVNGFEICINCSKDVENQAAYHSLDHAFQILLEDEYPTVQYKPEPLFKPRCCICWDDDDEEGDMVKLESCPHSAHLSHLKMQLDSKWTGKRVGFKYMNCGECNTPLDHHDLRDDLQAHLLFKKRVEDMVLTQAREDKLIDGLEALVESNQQEAVDTCMNIMACYICSSCSEPFCGGRVDCANDASLDLTKIRCQECNFKVEQHQGSPKQSESDIKWRGKCSTHGYKFAIYKCDSCCSVAVWDCRSNHYCERCHNSASSAKNYPCLGLGCPLGIPHPQNKSGIHGQVDPGFVIGCSKCFAGLENTVFESVSDNWKDSF